MHLPAEMVEEILLNLPVKSLLRFSSVSKTWKSMISESGFRKRYNRRSGGEMIALIGWRDERLYDVQKQTSELVGCPFSIVWPDILAFCKQLWLVNSKSSHYLWNPSMRTYKQLPNPSNSDPYFRLHFSYGVGYASVADDYKVLRMAARGTGHDTELYSRRSDSWRHVPSPSRDVNTLRAGRGAFVSGHLHWVSSSSSSDDNIIIIAFDLCTDTFGEVALPNTSRPPPYTVHLTVLSGMLCATLAYTEKIDVWVMEDYGVAQSWTNKFTYPLRNVRPLHLYQNGDILLVLDDLFLGEGGVTRPRLKCLTHHEFFYYGFLYAQSFVEP